MTRRLTLVLFLALTPGALAQFTTVAGTVVDPNGIPYAGGTITAQLVTAGATPTLNGLPFSMNASAGLNPAGSFTMQLADSNVMSPNLQWKVTVCSAAGTVPPSFGTGSQCFSVTLTITGASQNISSQLIAAAKALTISAGSSARRPWIDVTLACQVPTDGVSDVAPAVQACNNANQFGTLYFPPGTYSFLSAGCGTSGADKFAWCLNGSVHVLGGSQGQAASNWPGPFIGTVFKFAAGLTTIIPNSSAIAGVPAGVLCQGCEVDHINFVGGEPYLPADPTTAILPGVGDTSANYGASTGASQADGLRCGGTACVIHDNSFVGFGRHGIYLDGNSAGGNFADSTAVWNNYLSQNRGSGIFNRGSDSNASHLWGNRCYGNQLWCIENYAFLGILVESGTAHSQHVDSMAGHTSSFTISTISNSANVTTVTTSTNHNLAVGMSVVITGTTNYNTPACPALNCTVFVATVPAANRFTYAQTSPIATENAGTVANATGTQMWASAGNDAIGGCFRSTGGAVTSVFVNPYCESDNNGTNRINANTNIIIGGDIGNGFDWANNPPNWLTTASGGLLITPTFFVGRDTSGNLNDAQVEIGGLLQNADTHNGQILFTQNVNAFAAPAGSKGHLDFRLTDTTSGSGVWGWRCCTGVDNPGLSNYPFFMEYGATTGSNNANPKSGFPNGLLLGQSASPANRAWLGLSAVASLPTWFSQLQGSMALNPSAAAGGVGCFQAVTTGSPGTYKAGCPISNDATGTSWAWTPTATMKKGSGGGSYNSTSTTYVRLDPTNLAYTVTVPTGWKLLVHVSGTGGVRTAAVQVFFALADGSADNTGILVETVLNPNAVTDLWGPFALDWVLTGDGASHTFNLQYKTNNAADAVVVSNSATVLPVMTFLLTPSN